MPKSQVLTIRIHFIPHARWIWMLYNKDGIPIAKSYQNYRGVEKAKDAGLRACLEISHESIELDDT